MATEFNTSDAGQTPWATTGVQDQIVKSYWKRGTRWHDTTTGTWTSVDPITMLNDPNRADPFTYASNDPINQFDPAGRWDWDRDKWVEESQKAMGGGLIGGCIAGLAGGVAGCATGATLGAVGGLAIGAFNSIYDASRR